MLPPLLRVSEQDLNLQKYNCYVKGISKPDKWRVAKNKFLVEDNSELGNKVALIVFEKLCELGIVNLLQESK